MKDLPGKKVLDIELQEKGLNLMMAPISCNKMIPDMASRERLQSKIKSQQRVEDSVLSQDVYNIPTRHKAKVLKIQCEAKIKENKNTFLTWLSLTSTWGNKKKCKRDFKTE